MTPIAGLDEVSWASLNGTYRSAEDVPGQIEFLRSPQGDLCRSALAELSNATVHQGTPWQASPASVTER